MKRFVRTVFHPGAGTGVEQIGHDARPGTLPLPAHAHRGVEICYIASGEVVWVMGRRRMHLVGGMISVIQPGVAHHGEMDIIPPSDLYWIVLRPGRLRPGLPPDLAGHLAGGEPYAAQGGDRFGALFDAIMDECAAAQPGWRTATGAHAALLALEAARLSPTRQTEGRREPPPSVMDATRLLAGNLETPPSIRELARRVGLGPTRFHALFKRAVGLTPRDYVGRLRLAEARRALTGSREDITDLALRLGYPSSQYFSTVFRKHTGLTPSEFRKRSVGGRRATAKPPGEAG
jgi:AraC-like DNA-binding protein